MTKRQLIDEILTRNTTAEPAFLAQFREAELDAYLRHLRVLDRPRLTGDASRYEKYFPGLPTVPPMELEAPHEPVDEDAPAEAPEQNDDEAPDEADRAGYDEPAREEPAEAEETPSLVGVAVADRADDGQRDDSSFADREEDSESWLF